MACLLDSVAPLWSAVPALPSSPILAHVQRLCHAVGFLDPRVLSCHEIQVSKIHAVGLLVVGFCPLSASTVNGQDC